MESRINVGTSLCAGCAIAFGLYCLFASTAHYSSSNARCVTFGGSIHGGSRAAWLSRSSLKRREAESENPRGRSLTPIGCEWSALVVLTKSVVSDVREVHWSRVERRSESLPYCAVNAHAFEIPFLR